MKTLVVALLLPPAGPLLLAATGLLLSFKGWRPGWLVAVAGLLGAWAMSAEAIVEPLARGYAAAAPAEVLERDARACSRQPGAVVLVLGAGVQLRAHADGGADLKPLTAERLRRGLWWSLRLGLPLAFSGGVSPRAEPGTPTEASTVERTLSELGLPPLQWVDHESVDTRGNARFSAQQLRRHGSRCVVLVSHDLHMPRALAHFRRELPDVTFVSAGLGREPGAELRWHDWLPSAAGSHRGYYLSYELLGRWAGH